MVRSKQQYPIGTQVHCIHRKTLKNCVVDEYKYSQYILNYRGELFTVRRELVKPGWIEWWLQDTQNTAGIVSTRTQPGTYPLDVKPSVQPYQIKDASFTIQLD